MHQLLVLASLPEPAIQLLVHRQEVTHLQQFNNATSCSRHPINLSITHELLDKQGILMTLAHQKSN